MALAYQLWHSSARLTGNKMNVGRIAVCCALVAACTPAPQIQDRSDFLAEASRFYAGENQERVIRAAQIVLDLSDPGKFDFRNSLNGFTGFRKYFIYAVLAAQSGREKWEFTAEQTAGGVRASVSISDASVATAGYTTSASEVAMRSIPLHRLFWNRVEYVLRQRPDWVSCDQASATLPRDADPSTLSGLCGGTSSGRAAPPPEQFPPVAAPALKPAKKS